MFNDAMAGQTGAPQDLATQSARMSQAFGDAYGKHSFMSRHPILTGLGGLALFGPAGLMLPMAAKRNDAQRHTDLLKAYQDWQKTALENQANTDKITGPRNQSDMVNAILNKEVDGGRINPNTPALDQNSYYDPAFQKDYLSGATASGALNFGKQAIAGLQSQAPTLAGGQALPPAPQPKSLPPMPAMGEPSGMLPPVEDATLQAGAQYQAPGPKTYTPLDNGYNPAELPSYVDPAVANSLLSQMSSVANNTQDNQLALDKFQQGELPKIAAEIQKLAQEGKATEALALLRQVQAATERQRPNLIRAQSNQANSNAAFNARRYAGGPAPQQPNEISAFLQNATPEQRKQWAANYASYDKKPGANQGGSKTGKPVTTADFLKAASGK